MAWFQDLQPCSYFGQELSAFLRAVGWLDRGHPFPQGARDPAFEARLSEVVGALWEPHELHFRGWHGCDLGGDDCAEGGRSLYNVFVPADGVVYVCPEGIGHYVRRHRYLPPRRFIDAVMACPPVRSEAYYRAVAANGGGELLALDAWFNPGIPHDLLPPPPAPTLTLSAYRRIQPGMSLKEVEAILTCSGLLFRKAEAGRVSATGALVRSSTATVVWEEFGRSVTIDFEDGVVARKKQDGLS